jgi:hypothetical protein
MSVFKRRAHVGFERRATPRGQTRRGTRQIELGEPLVPASAISFLPGLVGGHILLYSNILEHGTSAGLTDEPDCSSSDATDCGHETR